MAVLYCVVILASMLSYTGVSACSCMLEHPQQYSCSADFVIVAKVKKVMRPDYASTVYKVKVKKELKATQKAAILLKSGRLVTSGMSSMCGVDLKLEETYLIAGHVSAGQARISLCSFIQPWRETSVRQRKGFKLLYKQGCNCKIVNCPWWRDCKRQSPDVSNWREEHFKELMSVEDQCEFPSDAT